MSPGPPGSRTTGPAHVVAGPVDESDVDTNRLGPREPDAAARTAAVLVLVAAVAMLSSHTVTYLSGDTDGTPLVIGVGVALVGLAGALWTLRAHVPAALWS